jgi:hypothetical protein
LNKTPSLLPISEKASPAEIIRFSLADTAPDATNPLYAAEIIIEIMNITTAIDITSIAIAITALGSIVVVFDDSPTELLELEVLELLLLLGIILSILGINPSSPITRIAINTPLA